ncbi:hypothetical protein [Sphingosinithalassobacter sp. CS137]|uniref:hypothetical protein n=1 Tax=Sphingosinithalassobacter sp. CS137 TaxID=2762748 RepID=UPI00165DA7B1|nr:hypothetical protein [Sphingosinithalassobacter sp. CS137]
MEHPPQRARAVFSTEDFQVLRAAIADYLPKVADKPESVKVAALYHRLGRLT